MKKCLCLIVCMTCLFSMAMAQDGGLSFVSKFASTAPTIDGVLASGEWDGVSMRSMLPMKFHRSSKCGFPLIP